MVSPQSVTDIAIDSVKEAAGQDAPPITHIGSHWFYEGQQRLDAGYYAADAMRALSLIEHFGGPTQKLQELVEACFVLGRFKRVYASSEGEGWPYLSATEALSFRPTSERWIARDHAPKDAQLHFPKQGWVLLSASGTVGRVILVTNRLQRFFLTHDLIRIIPSNVPVGYLYTYLRSWIGQALLTKDQYGSSIKHLEPHHIETIEVPLLPEEMQAQLHELIYKAYAYRDEANRLLDQADNQMHKELGLPRFTDEQVPYLPLTTADDLPYALPSLRAFTTAASHLTTRLDASFHMPVAVSAIAELNRGRFPTTKLHNLASSIVVPPRFKRIYVSAENGVPLLQGSHLPLMSPYGLQHISKTATRRLEQWIIEPGLVLVTCSGTLGRIAVSTSAQDGWAASQHILRVKPQEGRLHPGFLAAFLMTPYGQHQIQSKTYGGIVDELTAEDMGEVVVADAPYDSVQLPIGQLVLAAFENKEAANSLEARAISQLESALAEATSSRSQNTPDTASPFERFKALAQQVVAVSKHDLDKARDQQ
jgi:type I restriction enzyme, S subunit